MSEIPEPTNLNILSYGTYEVTLSWVPVPYAPLSTVALQGQTLQRRVTIDGEASEWLTIYSINTGTSISIETFQNSDGVANSKFEYRIRSYYTARLGGSPIYSDWTYFDTAYFKPTQPSKPKVVRFANGDIQLNWSNGKAQTAISSTTIFKYTGSYESLDQIAGASQEWLGQGIVSQDESCSFLVRNSIPTVGPNFYADSEFSAKSTIYSVRQPAPPGIVLDTCAVSASDGGSPRTAVVTVNPYHADGSLVSEVYIEVSLNGVVVTSYDGTDLVHTIGQSGQAQLVLGEVGTYQIRAWTKGIHPNASLWSNPVALVYAYSPVCQLTYPSGENFGKSRFYMAWSYYDAGGSAQLSALAVLKSEDGIVLESQTIEGSAHQVPFATELQNGNNYICELTVTSAVGLKSAVVSQPLTVSYAIPLPAQMTGILDTSTGIITLSGLQPAPDTSFGVDYVVCERKYGETWKYVGRIDIPAGTSTEWTLAFTDWIPPIGNVVYRFTSVTLDAGSVSTEVTVEASGGRFYLNWGDGFGRMVQAPGGELAYTLARGKELVRFAGRREPVEMASGSRERAWTFKAVGTMGEGADVFSALSLWEEAADAAAPVCMRDPLGHRIFASISDMAFTKLPGGLVEISGKATEIAWQEPVYDG